MRSRPRARSSHRPRESSSARTENVSSSTSAPVTAPSRRPSVPTARRNSGSARILPRRPMSSAMTATLPSISRLLGWDEARAAQAGVHPQPVQPRQILGQLRLNYAADPSVADDHGHANQRANFPHIVPPFTLLPALRSIRSAAAFKRDKFCRKCCRLARQVCYNPMGERRGGIVAVLDTVLTNLRDKIKI